MSKLTLKQECFCLEYLKDLNATQAAIRAGYKEKTARSIGSENLSKPDIQARISNLVSERNKAVKTDSEYVLRRLREIDELDILDIVKSDLSGFKEVDQWPRSWRISVSGLDMKRMVQGGEEDIEAIVEKVKWPDKVKNLELIGRHVDVGAWNGESASSDEPIGRIEIEVVGANGKD